SRNSRKASPVASQTRNRRLLPQGEIAGSRVTESAPAQAWSTFPLPADQCSLGKTQRSRRAAELHRAGCAAVQPPASDSSSDLPCPSAGPDATPGSIARHDAARIQSSAESREYEYRPSPARRRVER